jgi:TPR repeat protein
MFSFSAEAKTILVGGRICRNGVLALSLGAAAALGGCDRHPFFAPPAVSQAVAGACPRPDNAANRQPQFNQQQREVRVLREQGFRGDFFAQLELGGRYDARRDADKNLEDPVEAAVWYALALTNPEGYEETAPHAQFFDRRDHEPIVTPVATGSLYDDCRAFERAQASGSLNRLWSRMSSQEQEEVRRRIVYVLSTQGPVGFRILARATQTDTGPYGAPRAFGWRGPEHPRRGSYLPFFGSAPWFGGPPSPPEGPTYSVYGVELFPRNDVDAYLYDYLAAQSGDVGAYVLLKDFEGGSPDRAGYGDFVEAKANRWAPPFEFYPPEAPSSGVPHSDESMVPGEAGEIALSRIQELPFVHVREALRYLRVIDGSPFDFDHPGRWDRLPELTPGQVQTFQAMLGREQTGHLTELEKVRAIQYAAVNGSTHAQLVLAVMYAEGVGVRADYARAFHWFQEADRGGSPEAKFAIANYFSLGVAGVANQDKAKAVVYRLDSALAGFKPSANRIQAVLAQVSRKSRY